MSDFFAKGKGMKQLHVMYHALELLMSLLTAEE